MFNIDIGSEVAAEMDAIASSDKHKGFFYKEAAKKCCPADCDCKNCDCKDCKDCDCKCSKEKKAEAKKGKMPPWLMKDKDKDDKDSDKKDKDDKKSDDKKEKSDKKDDDKKSDKKDDKKDKDKDDKKDDDKKSDKDKDSDKKKDKKDKDDKDDKDDDKEDKKKESSLKDATIERLAAFESLPAVLADISSVLDENGLARSAEATLKAIDTIMSEAYDANSADGEIFPPNFDDAISVKVLDEDAKRLFEEEVGMSLEELDAAPGIEVSKTEPAGLAETDPSDVPSDVENMFDSIMPDTMISREDAGDTIPAPDLAEEHEEKLRALTELEPLSEEEKDKYISEANDWLDGFLAKKGADGSDQKVDLDVEFKDLWNESQEEKSASDIIDGLLSDFEDED